ncbi:MAG: hypothetical protein II767_05485, partial [Proteobacteria bacterium]|nr:hypothetical protein [Pseudomonadota bacterium]
MGEPPFFWHKRKGFPHKRKGFPNKRKGFPHKRKGFKIGRWGMNAPSAYFKKRAMKKVILICLVTLAASGCTR